MNRLLPLVIFVIAVSIGGFTVWAAYRSALQAEERQFDTLAGDVADAVKLRFGQHVSLVQATRSFLDASGGIPSRDAFRIFVDGLDITGKYAGVQGIGFALQIDTGDEDTAEALITRNYGLERAVWPETDQDTRTPIILLEPGTERNFAAIAFDMFQEETRRTAMLAALDAREARASGTVELVQEITDEKQIGFLVYLPYASAVENTEVSADSGPFVRGFVYAPFRAGDLFQAALSNAARLPASVEAFDVTDGVRDLVYRGSDFATQRSRSTLSLTRTIDIAGRNWELTIRPNAEYSRSNERDLALVLGVVALLLATALSASAHAQLKAADTAQKLADVSARSLEEKDLMLQEMKHRIKNSIARILAMARQTAGHSENLEDFKNAFTARLQAMSTAQDMLTRSHWQRAQLESLLTAELDQVFSADQEGVAIDGPDVLLDEKAAQSLGLTFHELATNALKYGGTSDHGSGLTVRWAITGSGEQKQLELDWQEHAGPAEAPQSSGFGTRLIDASIKGELSGNIERRYGEDGLGIHIVLPGKHFEEVSQPVPDAPRKRRRFRRRK